MSTQPATPVDTDDFVVTSTHEDDEPAPARAEKRVVKPIPDTPKDEEAERVSRAASELGKRGGEAAAKARKEAAKQAKPADVDEPEPAEPAEVAEADEPEPEQKADAPQKDKRGNPRHDPEARVREATRIAREAREEAERLRQELSRREREARPQDRPTEAKPAERPAGKPKVEDFDNWEDFVEALTEWKADEKITAAQRREQERAAQETRTKQAREKWGSFRERIAGVPRTDPAHKDKFTQFMEGIHPDVADLEPTSELLERDPRSRPGPANVVADYLFSSEKAPALMLHLSEHPDVFQRLATLQAPPQTILLEMARLEARLDAVTAGTSSKPEVSKAKPPVRPVTGSPHTADAGPDEDDEDLDRHIQYYNAKERRRA